MFIHLTKKIENKSLTTNQLILLVSVYFTLVLNLPFLSKITLIVTALEKFNISFLLSVPIFLCCLMVLFFSLFSLRILLKPVLIILIILSALLCYATFAYGIIFDYGMIQNTAETYSAEALSYVNLPVLLFFMVFALLPALFIWRLKLKEQTISREFLARVKLVSLTSLILLTLVYSFYQNYASVGRNNRILTSYLIPFKFIDSTAKYVKNTYLTTPFEFELLDIHPALTISTDDKKNVLVMVVGETARADSFHYNGYAKNTNTFTEQENIFYFNNMISCGTATAVSVPCMFSLLTHDSFDKEKAKNQQNALDIIQLAGVDVLWIDNNDGCKGVCKRIPTMQISTNTDNPLCDGDYCFDEVLLAPLAEKLKHLTAQNTLIVLHMIGSHGPTYFRRYPASQAKFLPDCQRSDIQNCDHQALLNTYDNTIAYTDFVLAQVIKQLKTQAQTINASMLYLSDHGESLGESGAYLHGFPYAFAPAQQTHIPMLFWPGNASQYSDQQCLGQLTQRHFSQDNIFDSLLGLTSVSSDHYQQNNDIFSTCRTTDKLVKLAHSPVSITALEKAIQ